MKHTLTLGDLIEQNYEIKNVIASSTKDKKKLILSAEAKYKFKPYFEVYVNNERVGSWIDLKHAINHYNEL